MKSTEMRVLLLVFCLFSLVSLEEAPNIRQVTSDLAIISRLTNGIAIQNQLLKEKKTGSEALADIIQIEKPKVLEDLKVLQTSDVSKKLDDLSDLLKSFGESSIQNAHHLRNNLEILPDFIDKLDLLEKASKTDLTENFRELASKVNKTDIRASVVGEWPIIFISEAIGRTLSLTELPKDDDHEIYKMKAAICRFRYEMEGYQDYIDRLKKYKEELDKHELIKYGAIDMEDVLEPVKKMKDLAVEYDRSRLGGVKMIEWMKELKDETEKVDSSNLLNNEDLIENLIKEIDELFPLIKDLSTTKVGSKPTELARIFQSDLKEKWFLEKFAEGNQTSIDKLKKSLDFLEKFNGKAAEVVQALNGFSENYTEYRVYSFKRIVVRVQETLDKIRDIKNDFADLKTSFDESIKCLEDNPLTYSRKEVDLNSFEKTYQYSLDLHKKIKYMEETIDEVLAMPEIEDHKMLQQILDAITPEISKLGLRMDENQAWATTLAIQKVDGIQEFYEKFQEAAKLLREVDNSGLNELLKQTQDFEQIQDIQGILSETNLIKTLECLKNVVSFKPEDSVKLMKLADKFRSLNEKDIVEAKGILGKMDEIKKKVGDVETVSKRTKREAESGEKELMELENSKKIADELEKGVEMFRKMIKVIDQKKSVISAINFGDKVDKAVFDIRMPPMQSVWTPMVRYRMKRIYRELVECEKLAAYYRTKELPLIFGIMGNATEYVHGLELDTNLFKVSVAPNLASSKDSDIQAAAKVFDDLSLLSLDFASHHQAMRTASSTVEPLRQFFDKFFGIDRTLKDKEREALARAMAEENEKKASGMNYLVFVLALFLLIPIILLIYFLRKRSILSKKLKDKETWRHLRFLSEGILTENDGTHYTPLHMAVLKKKFEEVKKLVKNGAYVDVHCFGKIIETPLHTAVSNKSLEFVKFLIKNGADIDALDSNYETPLDKAKGNKEMQNLIKDAKNKKHKKKLPQVLPVEKYKIFIDEKVKGKKEFCERYKANMIDKIEKATHVVVKTGKDGSLDLDKDDGAGVAYLDIICSHKMLMSSDWLSESIKKKTNFRDDFKFRVKKIKFKGKTYKRVDEIQLANSKMHVPYLTNSIVHFDQADLHTIDWTALKKVANGLGAQIVDEFPVMQGMIPGKCPYYRDDLGHIFVIYNQSNADKLTTLYPILKTDKAYTFLERDEFIELLLSQKVVHKKMKKSGEDGEAETTGATTTCTTNCTSITTGTTTTNPMSTATTPSANSTTPSASNSAKGV